MPLLSSLLGHRGRTSKQPVVKFHGPEPGNRFRAVGPTNDELACFCFVNGTIFRLPDTQQPICTMKRSSLSGTSTLQIHGQEVKIKQSWEGMQYGKDIQSPVGKFKWRPGCGGFEELRDFEGSLVARGKLKGMLGRKNSPLEVYIYVDTFLLDLIFASWTVMLDLKGDEAKETEAVAEMFGALVG